MNLATYVPWMIPLVLVGGYVLLFVLCGRPASLRPRRVGVLMIASALLQTGWIALRESGWHPLYGLPIATLVLGIAGWRTTRVWCLNNGAESFDALVETATQGLDVECDASSPGRYELTAKQVPAVLRATPIAGPFLRVVWPPAPAGRVQLLVNFLAKQYPGPVPVLRITLNRGRD